MAETTGAVENQQEQQVEDVNVETVEEIETLELTTEELEDRIKRESDRKVSRKLKELEAQHKQELEKKTAEARREAEELAKLSAEERAKVEKEKEEMRLTQEREELKAQRAEFEREKLLLETERQLTQRKLPGEFATYIIGSDAEDTLERITAFEEKWQAAIEAEIQGRLKQKAPKLGGQKKGFFTREQVEKMSQDEVTANLAEIEESMKLW